MTSYHIFVGTKITRYQWKNVASPDVRRLRPGGDRYVSVSDSETIHTTKPACYTPHDIFVEDNKYIVFRLPLTALPWTHIQVTRTNIICWDDRTQLFTTLAERRKYDLQRIRRGL
jgi:hypothetical protein